MIHIAFCSRQPRDGRIVPELAQLVATGFANGCGRMVANLTTGDVRDPFVQQRNQHADQPRLGLPAQSQQDEIVARQNRVDDLRDHRLLETDDAREERLALLQFAQQILAQLILDAAQRQL